MLGVDLELGLGFEPSSPTFVSSFSVLRGCPSHWYDLGTTNIHVIHSISLLSTRMEATETIKKPEEDTPTRPDFCIDVDVDVDVEDNQTPYPLETELAPENTNVNLQEVTATKISATTTSEQAQASEKTREKTGTKPVGDVTSCDQFSANSKANSAALKGKSRDKGAEKPSGRVTSRAQGTSSDTAGSGVAKKSTVTAQSAPVNYVLEPDPKVRT